MSDYYPKAPPYSAVEFECPRCVITIKMPVLDAITDNLVSVSATRQDILSRKSDVLETARPAKCPRCKKPIIIYSYWRATWMIRNSH